jgi:hypothetical protein
MAYVQHTQCIDVAKFKPLSYKAQPAIEMLVLFGGTLAWVAALIPIALGNPLCALHAIPLMIYGGLFGYCNWWLYYRLVCLGGDKCAIGLLYSVEPGTGKTWPGSYDTDYSVNLLLMSSEPNQDLATVGASVPYGQLVSETPALAARPDISFDPEQVTPDGATKDKAAYVLHAEFEGAGVWIMFLSSAAALMLVVAAIFVCQIPVWGWIASLILELLALLAALFGHAASQSDRAEGSPTDVNPSLGSLHPAKGNDWKRADVLYVFGTWVFDGGHQDEKHGWNEVHPIKEALKIGEWSGDWASFNARYQPKLCDAYHDAIAVGRNTATLSAQARRENQWMVHPLIDGCRDDDLPPIR